MGQNTTHVAIKIELKKNLVTFNKHQEESVPSSCVDCFCLSGPACEFQRLLAVKSSTGPLKQKTAVSLSVYAHQKVGNQCSGEGSNAEDAMLQVQSPEEGEGASSPHKNLGGGGNRSALFFLFPQSANF